MSILRPDPRSASAPGLPADDALGTALISRLAKEIWGGDSPSGTASSLPGAITPDSGLASAFPATATATAPSPAASPAVPQRAPENALANGFPATSSTTPVHPTVVAPEKNPDAAASGGAPGSGTPSGTHRRGSREAHEFGEPDPYRRLFGYVEEEPAPNPVSRTAAQAHRDPRDEPAIPGLEAAEPESPLYFLTFPGKRPPLPGLGDLPEGNPVVHSPHGFDVESVRRDFPVLHQRVNGHPLVWLDNAATTQKPKSVIESISNFYRHDNSNIHRAAHALAERSTTLFEEGREKVRRFLGAGDKKEIVFLRGTTEAINLVAQSYGKQNIGPGDEILISQIEHHANIVPWQILAGQTGAALRVIPINDRGELLLEKLPELLTARTKIVSVTQVSNSLGTINPVEEIIRLAHSRGIPVLVDGAQSTPHLPINVQAMDADFFVFSGHKVFGPTGIGALYAKSHLLESMPPWQGGGHMIRDVTFERTVYNHPPEKFEAGTPDIAGVVGLAAAIDYMFGIGIPAIAAYEHSLLEYATHALAGVKGLRPIGTADNKASVLGFVIPGIANEKIASHLDHDGIAVRAGHHCALPSLRHFGVESTVRPSLAFYNTFGEVDALVASLHRLTKKG